jgi:hypothetical protein
MFLTCGCSDAVRPEEQVTDIDQLVHHPARVKMDIYRPFKAERFGTVEWGVDETYVNPSGLQLHYEWSRLADPEVHISNGRSASPTRVTGTTSRIIPSA